MHPPTARDLFHADKDKAAYRETLTVLMTTHGVGRTTLLIRTVDEERRVEETNATPRTLRVRARWGGAS